MSRTPIATLLLAAAALLSACDAASDLLDRPREVTAASAFTTHYRPAPDPRSQVRALLASGGMAAADAGEPPMYSDIVFFPVVRADAVAASDNAGWRHHDSAPQLGGIDFGTHFAFLVAHPDASASYAAMTSGQHAMYFSSVKVSYPKDRVLLHLSGSRLGDLDPMTALTARWKGNVYPIERRGRERLEVRLDDNAYRFSLVDAGSGAAAAAPAVAKP